MPDLQQLDKVILSGIFMDLQMELRRTLDCVKGSAKEIQDIESQEFQKAEETLTQMKNLMETLKDSGLTDKDIMNKLGFNSPYDYIG